MRGEVHILANCPIDTFLKEKQHSALYACLKSSARSLFSSCSCPGSKVSSWGLILLRLMRLSVFAWIPKGR